MLLVFWDFVCLFLISELEEKIWNTCCGIPFWKVWSVLHYIMPVICIPLKAKCRLDLIRSLDYIWHHFIWILSFTLSQITAPKEESVCSVHIFQPNKTIHTLKLQKLWDSWNLYALPWKQRTCISLQTASSLLNNFFSAGWSDCF